ncbi:ELOV7 protein, partial [Fregetta grallaria]|nr:ELOV7 protein [Fregetta grallaria]
FIKNLFQIFFVLRKKNNQVTFLHVFHHSIMPWTWWFGVKFAAGTLKNTLAITLCFISIRSLSKGYCSGCFFMPGFFNSRIFKIQLLAKQLVQFIMITGHIGQIYIMDDCPYQYPIFMFIIWLYGSVFLVLFLHFWYHAYTKGQRLPKMARNGISKDQ